MVENNIAVFLDRDGVVNECIYINNKCFAPKNISDFKFINRSIDAIIKLKKKKYKIFIVSNQPDVGNKKIKKEIIFKMNAKILKEVKIDEIKYCFHSQTANCDCRKPKPKMITDLARKYQINLKRSFMIGDRHSDMVAGRKAGCTPIFIKNDLIEESNINNYKTFKNLFDATNFILKFDGR